MKRRRSICHVPGSPALEVVDLTVRYPRGVALEHVDLRLESGEHIAVLGPNGAGKSTLLKAVAGVLSPSSGKIRVYGHGPGGHVCIAYVPQRSSVDWRFPVTVRDVVGMGRTGRILPWRRMGSADERIVEESLFHVGLGEEACRQIGELSGGQQQRMFIARALAQEAELFLLDEPLAGLDATTQEAVLNLIEGLSSTAVMVALHELGVARKRFFRLLLLNRRVIALGPPSQVLTADHLGQAYGSALQFVRTADGMFAVGDSCCPPEGSPR